jgi:hypothetical protein
MKVIATSRSPRVTGTTLVEAVRRVDDRFPRFELAEAQAPIAERT